MKKKEPSYKKSVCAYVHKVAAGDTLYKIARHYGVDYGRLMVLNGITNPYSLRIGTEICIPPSVSTGIAGNCAGYYTIREGDTLYSIARNFGLNLDDLMAANSDVDPYNMHIGMKICIPPRNPVNRPATRSSAASQTPQQSTARTSDSSASGGMANTLNAAGTAATGTAVSGEASAATGSAVSGRTSAATGTAISGETSAATDTAISGEASAATGTAISGGTSAATGSARTEDMTSAGMPNTSGRVSSRTSAAANRSASEISDSEAAGTSETAGMTNTAASPSRPSGASSANSVSSHSRTAAMSGSSSKSKKNSNASTGIENAADHTTTHRSYSRNHTRTTDGNRNDTCSHSTAPVFSSLDVEKIRSNISNPSETTNLDSITTAADVMPSGSGTVTQRNNSTENTKRTVTGQNRSGTTAGISGNGNNSAGIPQNNNMTGMANNQNNNITGMTNNQNNNMTGMANNMVYTVLEAESGNRPSPARISAPDPFANLPYVSDVMPDGIIYNVEQGETLTDILRKFGICFSALDYNNSSIDLNQDLSGLTLNIPYGDHICIAPNNQPYIIRRNDTLDNLSIRFDISTDELLRLNPTKRPEDFSSVGSRINISSDL